ncbi:hypothetical protein GTA51_03845 [Desulfovibrio aerotolerans]|uniref:SnoaL-like domain-containing protein n=1 Tax=Solidesulfovibrio aerotolerans TaxID=295255 RepID=A0A7C9ME14_9BACT|nr:hypothetical protein [Solidesulfovibrio aerotolerans]
MSPLPQGNTRLGRPAAVRLLLVLCALLALLPGCAGKAAPKDAPKPTGFASADAKNVHAFIVAYPAVAASGDAKALLRLFTDDARVVPLLGNAIRPIRSGELAKQLPAAMADERRMGLRLVWREPMDIQTKGERASVRVVADLAWEQAGQEKQAVMDCFFGLVRDEHLMWKIKEFHGEPVGPNFRLPPAGSPQKPLPPRDATLKGRKTKRVIKGEPPKKAQPAPATAPQPASQPPAEPAPAPTGGQIVPTDEAPKPLF